MNTQYLINDNSDLQLVIIYKLDNITDKTESYIYYKTTQ